MEGYEGTALVWLRKLFRIVERKIVWCPVGRKCRDGFTLSGAHPHFGAMSAIFGSQHELVQRQAVIAIGPAKVGAALKLNKLFSRFVSVLLQGVVLGPILAELIAPVHRSKEPPSFIERESFT